MTKPEFIDTMGEIALDLIDDALKSVKANSENLQMIDPDRPSALSPKKRTNMFKYIAGAAACLAVVCAVGLAVWRFGGSSITPNGNFSDSVSEPAQSDNYSNSVSEPVLDGQVTILGKRFYTFSGYVRLDNMGITDEQLREIVPLLEQIHPLKTLYLDGNKISDISPLSSFTELEYLNLNQNQISDISPLGKLSKLGILNMNGNNISDMTPLEGCTGLTFIGLDNNEIADITPLKGLAELDVVNLKENRITDLSPLSGLDLTSLGLGSNNISDVSPLGKITGLENLDLSDNDITDVTPLGSLMKLKTLDISDNQISDIDLKQLKESLPDCEINSETKTDGQVTILGETYDINTTKELMLNSKGITDEQLYEIAPLICELSHLTSLHLEYNDISDLTPLTGLTGLNELWLDSNLISDITPLGSLTGLTALYLPDNMISDISALSKLTALKELALDENQVTDISPLLDIIYLKKLYLRSCPISGDDMERLWKGLPGCEIMSDHEVVYIDGKPYDVGTTEEIRLSSLYMTDEELKTIVPHLKKLTNLKRLILSNNRISDISPLAELTGLEYLSVNTCQITDISPLGTLTNLTTLNLAENQIGDISTLSSLTRLKYLYLNTNQISDISPLAALAGLDRLTINGNPVSDTDIKRLEDSLPNCSIIWEQHSDNG